jgi:hypothetical protein
MLRCCWLGFLESRRLFSEAVTVDLLEDHPPRPGVFVWQSPSQMLRCGWQSS